VSQPDLPEITGSVRPVLVRAPAAGLMWAAWSDGHELYLADADVAELAGALGDDPRGSRTPRHHRETR
jgi:hypothetical protein